MENGRNKPIGPAFHDQNGRQLQLPGRPFLLHPRGRSPPGPCPHEVTGQRLSSIPAPPAFPAFAFHGGANYPFCLAGVRCCAARAAVYMRFTLPNLFFF